MPSESPAVTERSPLSKIMDSSNYDIAIVGSGPMGTAVASICVRAGLRVIMLEGGDRPPLDRYGLMERAITEEIAWKFDPWRYEMNGDDLLLNTFAVRKVGGSSVAWGAVTPRFLESDFKLQSKYGIAVDWPVDYEKLEPFYGKAEWFMGVSGAADDRYNGPRSTPFPMPAFPMGATEKYVKDACAKLDIDVHSVPSARNSVPFQGRSKCVNYGICRACPNGALFSSDQIVRRLEAEPNFRLLTGASASKVLVDANGTAEAIEYFDENGRQQTLRAGRFVIATQGVENVRILLNSATDKLKNGVANSSGTLGKYLTEHVKFYFEGRVPERLDPHTRGYETATTLKFHDHEKRGRYAGTRLLIRENGGPSPADFAWDSGLWGEDLRKEMRETFGRFVTLGAFMEQLPYESNRVTLSESLTDRYGMPAARVDFKLMHAYEERGHKEMSKIIKKIYQTMGGTGIREIMAPAVSGHYMSCHRMGDDPKKSVVDSYMQTHDTPNLYLASIGAFPTGGISNPTLTGVALAIRMAEKIVREEQKIALVS